MRVELAQPLSMAGGVLPTVAVRKMRNKVGCAESTVITVMTRGVGLVILSCRLSMLPLAIVVGFASATSNRCMSWPRGEAALQALHPKRMKVQIAGLAVGKVLVALGVELSNVVSIRIANMAAERTAREG